jgi:hypothetical protein
MAGLRPRQLARLGQFYLEEAVLDVLLREAQRGGCIGAAEISVRAGIFRDRGVVNIINDAIATGVLVKLFDEGKVERCEQASGRGGWKLTDAEFARRRDEVDED